MSQAAVLLGLQALLAAKTGSVHLPGGRFEVTHELRLPDGARNLTIIGSNTTLAASKGFRGRAILSCLRCEHLTIRNLNFDGNRAELASPLPIAPSDVPFSRFYANNGILADGNTGLSLDRLAFANIANFAILVSRSKNTKIKHISVIDSGSLNAKGRNNTTGGVLLEEGTTDFSISASSFRNIRGNAVWTHSRYRSPLNLRGRIEANEFAGIGRDAIQVGHASQVTVTGNTGRRIGFPSAEVDVEGGGTPVGIDTAGNVSESTYEHNRFEEVNGKCIDLDGFHDGTVRNNTCINRGKPEDYPFGNFGISLNNTSVEMRSRNILIEGNTLDGMKFGGIFVVGSGHRILNNTMRHLNTAHCNETHARFGCLAILGEPGFLESGIYLAARAEKPDPARNNTIQNNVIAGWKMEKYCVRAAPEVSVAANLVKGNRCTDE